MSRPYIRLGDAHSHGGSVTSAASSAQFGGRGIATVGDTALCEIHGATTIVEGDPSLLIQGRRAARDGDTLACGAALIASQTSISRQ